MIRRLDISIPYKIYFINLNGCKENILYSMNHQLTVVKLVKVSAVTLTVSPVNNYILTF